MEFEWDEAKRLVVLEKHRVDFADVMLIFDGPHIILSARSEVEARNIAVGPLVDRIISVIFTRRGDVVRLITARGARKSEKREYRAMYT